MAYASVLALGGSTDFSLEPHPLSFPTFGKFARGIADHFVPHERNNYHPHILGHRFLGLVSLLLIGVKVSLIAGLVFSPAIPIFSSAITTDNVFSLTNQSRGEYNLGVLNTNGKLAQAAQAKAEALLASVFPT